MCGKRYTRDSKTLPVWKPDHFFWLTVLNKEEQGWGALNVVLGFHPLRITAIFEGESDESENRDGHIDITVVSFDRKSHTMCVNVVENDTDHRLNKRTLTLKLDGISDCEICAIIEIDGVDF